MRGSSVPNKRSTKPARISVSKKLRSPQRGKKASTARAGVGKTAKRLT